LSKPACVKDLAVFCEEISNVVNVLNFSIQSVLALTSFCLHPLLLARFFPARPSNTLTRPLQPSTNESDQAATEAELQAREQRVTQRETELEKRAAELDGWTDLFIVNIILYITFLRCLCYKAS